MGAQPGVLPTVLVFVRQRLVLLATPKTASTALHMALAGRADIVTRGLPGVKHISFAKYQRLVEPLVLSFTGAPPETMALVREPVDWLASWYRYRQAPALRGSARSTAGLGFEAFVEAWLAPEPPPCARVGSQAAYLCHPDTGARVQTLWRYEALDTLTAHLTERLGQPVRLARVNASPAAPAAGAAGLSAATRRRLAAALEPDFALHAAARA